MSDSERVKRAIEDAAMGNSVANKLYYDPYTKSFRTTNSYHNPDSGLSVTNRETKFAAC